MKTYPWLILSIFTHLLVFGSLWLSVTKSQNLSSDSEILDLTLQPVALSNDKLQKFAKPTKPQSIAKKAVAPTVSSVTPSLESAVDDSQTEGSSAVVDLDNDTEGAVSWNEVSRLPKVLKEFKATYPIAAKSAQIDGPVVLDIVIDRAGKVREVKLINGPGHGLNESAMEALKKFEFSPAYKKENTVPVKIRYTYRFRLDVN